MDGVVRIKQHLSPGLSALLVSTMGPGASTSVAYQALGSPLPGSTPTAPAYAGQAAPETAEDSQALVAPIALYPNALVAQILSAATFPRSDRPLMDSRGIPA
jgi:hypothetical protein